MTVQQFGGGVERKLFSNETINILNDDGIYTGKIWVNLDGSAFVYTPKVCLEGGSIRYSLKKDAPRSLVVGRHTFVVTEE